MQLENATVQTNSYYEKNTSVQASSYYEKNASVQASSYYERSTSAQQKVSGFSLENGKTAVLEEECQSRETVTAEEHYNKMKSENVLKSASIAESSSGNGNMRPLGIGFLMVGDNGYGMSATQFYKEGSDDVFVNVRMALGDGKYNEYEVNLSTLDTTNATAIEMFAYCQYADANGTGADDKWGSWHTLKMIIDPATGMNMSSIDEAVNSRRNWNKAIAEAQTVLERKSTGERISAKDLIEMLRNTHILKPEDVDNKDWRGMSDEQWEKFLKGIDSYIDGYKEQIKNMVEMQNKAAQLAATQASADMRAAAASSAALAAALNEIFSGFVEGSGDSETDINSWTYELETDNQIILTRAKLANESGIDALSKAQELMLTGSTTEGIRAVDDAREIAESDDGEGEEKIWTVTSFSEQGIISKKFKNGKEIDSWELMYNNKNDYKKVWDYIDSFDKNASFDFAGDINFWKEFLK